MRNEIEADERLDDEICFLSPLNLILKLMKIPSRTNNKKCLREGI